VLCFCFVQGNYFSDLSLCLTLTILPQSFQIGTKLTNPLFGRDIFERNTCLQLEIVTIIFLHAAALLLFWSFCDEFKHNQICFLDLDLEFQYIVQKLFRPSMVML